jgi:hypothetical protein
VGITKSGLEFMYLKRKENSLFVPREALVRAVELIEEEYEDSSKYNKYVYQTLKRIETWKKYDERKLMIVKNSSIVAFHLTGSYTLVEGEPISIQQESKNFYFGMGYYSSFMDVLHLKESLREPTEEEIKKYS